MASSNHANRRSLRGLESLEQRIALSATPYATTGAELAQAGAASFGSWAYGDPHEVTDLNEALERFGLTGEGQTVVIIDSGIAYDHVALGGDGDSAGSRYVGGYDFAENDDDPYDDGPYGSHGTHVAGILAGEGDAMQGVAPGADIISLRVFDDQGQGEVEWVEQALRWVHDHLNDFDNPITTVNLSLGVIDTTAYGDLLDDELAQLAEDGVFVTVAAGNSFALNQDTSLAFPADSQYVTPVASVDNSGSLSFFSQRNEAVIAAPGRSILSAVPDDLGDHDGLADDYGRFSGTSMAAPYVAGASMLVREAMMIAGEQDITADDINAILHSTADTTYDPITGQSYHVLNVEQAIEYVLRDDYGSTPSEAFDVGTVADTLDLRGHASEADDHDYFTFTATQTGLFSATMHATGGLALAWDASAISGATVDAASKLSFEITAGCSYTLGVVAGEGLGAYTLAGQVTEPASPSTPTHPSEPGVLPEVLPEPITVNGTNHLDTVVSAEGTWIGVWALRDGVLSMQFDARLTGAAFNAKVYNAAGDEVATLNNVSTDTRLDIDAHSDEMLYVYLWSARPDACTIVDIHFTNLLTLRDGELSISGTDGDDTIVFETGDVHRVTINDIVYEFSRDDVERIAIDALAGHDTLQLITSAANDRVVVKEGLTTVVAANHQLTAEGFENMLLESGGGHDIVHIHGTSANDRFTLGPRLGQLSTPEYSVLATGFHETLTWGGGGSADTVVFNGSTGDDRLRTTAKAVAMWNDTYRTRAEGFSRIIVNAENGGNDVAVIDGTSADDYFIATPDFARLYAPGLSVQTIGFDQVTSVGLGGNDRAYLYDSSGDDRLIVSDNRATISGNGFSITADGYETTSVRAVYGGNDTAYLYDTAHDDTFYARGSVAELTDAAHTVSLLGFDTLNVRSARGGDDKAEVHAVDYALHLLGDWDEA